MLVEILASISPASWCGVLLALSLLLIWRMMSPNHPNLPPSPGLDLPIIGHLYMMSAKPREQFLQWREQLGDVYRLHLGSTTMVVLCGYETVKEALVRQADIFSDRPTNFFANDIIPGVMDGIVNSSGHNWKTQRTVSLNILRNFGMGKNILANKICEEVDILLKELCKADGKPQDLKQIINVSISNNISSIVFGHRFEFNDPKFIEMLSVFQYLMHHLGTANILDFLPGLRILPFNLFGAKEKLQAIIVMRTYIKSLVDDTKKQYNPSNLDNFIVAYLDEIKKNEKNGVESLLSETKLPTVIDNVFIAGTETTSTTILWCLLYALHYPQVQEKIYQEIHDKIGTERPPLMTDKPKLKYVNATIMETQRIASIAPMSIGHACSQDTTINGYHIPKGAVIVPSLDSILLDKQIWGDPQVFRPERFLDQEGNLVKREELVPFSMGRRLCLGESLAKMELFLYLSSLFQKFKFLPSDPKNLPPLEFEFGVTCPPVPYEVRCVAREL